MISVLAFFIILSILILIHELGHFIAAKKNNVYVEEFGFGLPPRILSIRFGETLYSLNLLPFGGFVKLLGEEEDVSAKKLPVELKKRSFLLKKPLVKALIIIAGVLANFFLGWLIISYLFTQGVPTPTDNVMVEKVARGSPAEKAGLQEKDLITSATAFGTDDLKIIKNPLKKTEDLISLSKNFAGRQIILTIKRQNKEFKVFVVPRTNPPAGEGPLGVVVTTIINKKYPFYLAPFFGFLETVKLTFLTLRELLKMLFNLITFKKIAVDVAGPLGIAKLTSQVVKFGGNALLQFLALLSINLAVINIFPFPALDGGRLIFVIYEWLSKKRVNPKIEKTVNSFGFAVLISLIILITINDLTKFFVK